MKNVENSGVVVRFSVLSHIINVPIPFEKKKKTQKTKKLFIRYLSICVFSNHPPYPVTSPL